jgi:prepilin-type N-terminal cleavage/methylation domain-containing protein
MHRHGPGRTGQAFTLIELLVVIAIIAILLAILVPSLGAARRYAQQVKDSTHIRSIVQGMTVWAGQHGGAFPRPSEMDRANATIDPRGQPGLVKDNSGNILSVLIFNGMVDARQMVSPVETSERIEVDVGYERDEASRAEEPSLALWDPGFAGFPGEQNSFTGVPSDGRRLGDLDGTSVGHTSYAIAFPFGDRASAWSGDFDGDSVVAGNRGPVYIGAPGDWSLAPNQQGTGSATLGFYGADDRWEGHIGYGDTRVDFSRRPDPEGLTFSFRSGSGTSSAPDNVFVNENDNEGWTGASAGDQDRPGRWTNAYIRPWGNVQPGSEPKDPRVTLFRD